MANIFEKYIII